MFVREFLRNYWTDLGECYCYLVFIKIGEVVLKLHQEMRNLFFFFIIIHCMRGQAKDGVSGVRKTVK